MTCTCDWKAGECQAPEGCKAVAEVERLRAVILSAGCPGGGYNGIPDGVEPTVAACVNAGVCGCMYGAALKQK